MRDGRLTAVLPRASLDVAAALELVRPICDDVRRRGAAAIRELTARFDGVDVESPSISRITLTQALTSIDPALRAALEEAIRRARLVHEAQRPADVVTKVAEGAQVTER